MNITFPSGKVFSAKKESAIDGFYKKTKTKINFYRPNGEIFLCLKKNSDEYYPLFISATLREDLGNKVYYSYLSSKDNEALGFDKIKYTESSDFTRKTWEELNKE